MTENGEIMTIVPETPRHDLTVARDPNVVLEEARRAATALKTVIAQKAKPVIFNGEQYLEFEDLSTLAKFYGITAKVISTQFVEFGEARGFEAKAVAYHIQTAQEISAAEAMCLTDEPNWSKKPMFQLRSMAQTRACAKALRNVLSWVVVLAGYKATPAEEVIGQHQEPIQTPKAHEPGKKISEAQRKRFFAIYKSAGKTDEQVKAYLRELIDSESTADITVDRYESLCAWAQSA